MAINPLPLNPSILNPEPWGEVFQITTHKETTVNEVAEAIKALIEKKTDKKISIEYASPRIGDVKRNYSDISKARKILGYKPGYSLEAGLVHTFDYFREKI